MFKFLWCLFFFTAAAVLAQVAPPVDVGSDNLLGGTLRPKKPEIQELLKLNEFTNASGLVMVKMSGFWAAKFETTQEEYKKIVGSNPSQFQNDRFPVDSVSWSDAMAFCQRLTQAEREEKLLPEGHVYTLPTQRQWETLAAGASLADAVTSDKASRTGPAPVGSLSPTAGGIYDIRGNVWEFCLDPADQPYRVLRGGAWNVSYEPSLRLEFRWYAKGPEDRQNVYGFRCVLLPGR